MKSGKPAEQPYQIVYGASAVIGEAAYIYLYIMFLITVAYLIFFVPLSYQQPNRARDIWQIGIWVLWLIAFLSSVFFLAFRFSYDRDIRWLGWVAFVSCMAIWAAVLALNFLGLYPTNAFVPTVIIATVTTYFLLDQLYLICLRYKHYLSRAITFAQNGSVLLALLASINFVIFFGRVTRTIFSPDRQFSADFVISILELIGLGIITYFASNLNLNDPRGSQFKTIISITICFALAAANYIIDGYLSFWWLGFGALSSSVFYSAHSPTKRKSSGVAIGLYCGLSLAVFLDNITFRPTTSEFWVVFKDLIIPILGVLIAAVAGGGSLIKTIFPKLRSQKISKTDVRESSKEFIDLDGLSVDSIDQIMRIAILAKDFNFCDSLSDQSKSFYSKELREYFEIYYLCVQFEFQGHVNVTTIDMDENNEQVNKRLTIRQRDDFVKYINNRFPTYVSDTYIWYGYAAKGYITEFIGEKTLNKARPETLYTRVTTFTRNAFIILLVILAFSSQVLGPFMNVLPSLAARLATWNNSRKNEVRLILTSAMQPYEFDDPDVQKYYAISMWYWVQNRETYVGDESNGHLYMPTETMQTQINYMETIHSLYKEQDDFFFRLSNELGGYYKGLGDCDKAVEYFDEVLAGAKSIKWRDTAIAKSADCYKEQDLPKALDLLQEAYGDTSYIQSRSILAKLYYEQGKYNQIVELLNPISDSIDLAKLSFLGESLYYEGGYANSIEILEKALTDYSLMEDDRKIHSELYLGAAYFEVDEPFQSAEYYYKAFSSQICPYNPVLSDEEEEIHIPQYKSAIEMVGQRNSADNRTNLWNFVYYIYYGETEKAFDFFIVHLDKSPDYELIFSKCVVEMIKTTK